MVGACHGVAPQFVGACTGGACTAGSKPLPMETIEGGRGFYALSTDIQDTNNLHCIKYSKTNGRGRRTPTGIVGYSEPTCFDGEAGWPHSRGAMLGGCHGVAPQLEGACTGGACTGGSIPLPMEMTGGGRGSYALSTNHYHYIKHSKTGRQRTPHANECFRTFIPSTPVSMARRGWPPTRLSRWAPRFDRLPGAGPELASGKLRQVHLTKCDRRLTTARKCNRPVCRVTRVRVKRRAPWCRQ